MLVQQTLNVFVSKYSASRKTAPPSRSTNDLVRYCESALPSTVDHHNCFCYLKTVAIMFTEWSVFTYLSTNNNYVLFGVYCRLSVLHYHRIISRRRRRTIYIKLLVFIPKLGRILINSVWFTMSNALARSRKIAKVLFPLSSAL